MRLPKPILQIAVGVALIAAVFYAVDFALKVVIYAGLYLHEVLLGQLEKRVLTSFVMVNKPAPAFDLPALQAGQPGFKTADFRGKVTIINFFASWCVPCRDEHPILSRIPVARVALVGIDYKDRPEDAKAWLTELGNPYKTVVVDANGRTSIDFDVSGVPETYIVDKQGVIRFKKEGPLTPDIINNQLIPLAEKLGK